jgi:hypothetical protein
LIEASSVAEVVVTCETVGSETLGAAAEALVAAQTRRQKAIAIATGLLARLTGNLHFSLTCIESRS